MNIWLSLEHIPGLSAIPFVWRQELGDNFDPFKSAFLQSAPDNPAQFVPCPRARGCHHEVRTRSTASHFQSPLTSEAGPPSTASDFQPSPTAPEVSTHSTASHFASPLIAVCRCYPGRCDSFSLTVEDVTSLELDWPKLGRALCRAFGLVSKPANPGLFNALQIASWSPDLSRQSTAAADAIPVILTIPSSSRELLHIAATLIARLGHPFILLAPTSRHLGAAARELLADLGAIFCPLDAHVAFDPATATLSAINPQATIALFPRMAPQSKTPSDEDLAGRVCLLLDDLDTGSRRKHPSLVTVFRLYFIHELTVAQVARKCRCSVGTVSNRLKLLQSKTGAAPAQLRRISPLFNQLHHDLTAANSDYLTHRRR